ncbi:MAG: tetratricopeptide repeat protein [Candidatus Obscuribacterales bacterium]|nr:tetratricopeptide repeat protein [Candidatus Obscuribacterales bacterium]
MFRIATLLLTGVLISIGTLVGVVNVGNLAPKTERDEYLKTQLQFLKDQPPSVNTKEQIADTQWQLNNLSAAEKIWYERWIEMTANWKTAEHKDFCVVAQNLASVYIDHGNFNEAEKIYQVIIDYDRRLHGTKSAEVARDHNNLALCLYLKGTALNSKEQRKQQFQDAVEHLRQSDALWNELKTKQSAVNVENNDRLLKLVLRDIAS